MMKGAVKTSDLKMNFPADAALLLIGFLDRKCNFKMCHSRTQSTIRYETVIDALVQTYINQFATREIVSYLSYHKPLVLFVQCENM